MNVTNPTQYQQYCKKVAHLRWPIYPRFSGTVPIFNDVSRKKTQFSRDAHLSRFWLCVADLSRHWQTSLFHRMNINTPFTRYNRLSNRLYNWFDNRAERIATVRSTGCQTRLYNRFDNWLYTWYSRLSKWLWNGFDNRLNVCIHDTTGCTTGLTTGCVV